VKLLTLKFFKSRILETFMDSLPDIRYIFQILSFSIMILQPQIFLSLLRVATPHLMRLRFRERKMIRPWFRLRFLFVWIIHIYCKNQIFQFECGHDSAYEINAAAPAKKHWFHHCPTRYEEFRAITLKLMGTSFHCINYFKGIVSRD
jgi:hypothetical protein